MAHSYEELHKMTVTQLRRIAEGIEHDAVKGFSTMHKEKLLLAICVALGIEAHEHHQVVGIDRGLKSIAQRVASQENSKGSAAAFQLAGAGDNLFQRLVFTPIVVDGMQAGGAAGRLVRLGQDFDGQAQCGPQHGDESGYYYCGSIEPN